MEPLGLDKGDGSRPDGITVFPFSGGRSLVWDCTCVDTFAGVHLNRSAMEAGTAANNAEERKRRKYAALAEAHQFEPIAVETIGVYGESTGAILWPIGRRLVEVTGEPREVSWFRQKPGYIYTARQCMRSVFSQPVGRGFRRSWESRSTQPLTLFLREFPFPGEISFPLLLILKFFNVLIFCE